MWVHISIIVIVCYNRSLFQSFLCVFCGRAGSCLQWHNSEVFSWQKSSVIDMFSANEHAEIFACVLLRNKSHFKELINCNNHHCFQNDVLENTNFIFLFETFLVNWQKFKLLLFLEAFVMSAAGDSVIVHCSFLIIWFINRLSEI